MLSTVIVVGALFSIYTATPSSIADSCYIEKSIDYSINYNERVEGYREGEKVLIVASTIPFRDVNGNWLKLQIDAAENFVELAEKAEEAGFSIRINSAFRTRREQRRLRRRLGEIAAKVGWSNHQTGTAVDIAGTTAFIPYKSINKNHYSKEYCKHTKHHGVSGVRCPTRLFWWLKKNGPSFGFYNTVEHEPWHWDYNGF